MVNVLLFIFFIVFTLTVLVRQIQPMIWIVGSMTYLIISTLILSMPKLLALPLWIVTCSAIAILSLSPLRKWLSAVFFKHAQKVVPRLSKTEEEEALNAGDTWIEKSIFLGQPDWDGLFELRQNSLMQNSHLLITK